MHTELNPGTLFLIKNIFSFIIKRLKSSIRCCEIKCFKIIIFTSYKIFYRYLKKIHQHNRHDYLHREYDKQQLYLYLWDIFFSEDMTPFLNYQFLP